MRLGGNTGLAGRKGFTLVEVCIVTIISGLIFVAMFDLYQRYAKQQTYDITLSHAQTIASQIGTFRAKKQRYPCPSDRTLRPTDANFGKEIDPAANLFCNLAVVGLTPGNCYSNAAGLTPAGTNGVGGICMFACSQPNAPNACGDKTGAANNMVLIGGVPITAIRAVVGENADNATDMIYDGWGSQLDYVVTFQLTNKNTYRFDRGAITVHDENANDTASIVNNGHYGIISHGPDRIGAYTRFGQMTAICGSHVPQSYANPAPMGPGGDDQNCSNTATFIQGIRNDSKTALHYDDITYFVTVAAGGLWAPLPPSDMYNVNAGIVNVGTNGVALPPAAGVALNVGDPLGGTAGVVHVPATNSVKAKQICRKDETNCFDITAITTGITACPAGQVMTGLTTVGGVTQPTCLAPTFKAPASITNQQCPSGKWMIGLATDGTIICQP